MPRGVDTRFDPNRRPGGRYTYFTDGVTRGNETFAEQRETYRDELEGLMSEHPTGMPKPGKTYLVDKGMRPGTSAAAIREGSLKKWNDPSIMDNK